MPVTVVCLAFGIVGVGGVAQLLDAVGQLLHRCIERLQTRGVHFRLEECCMKSLLVVPFHSCGGIKHDKLYGSERAQVGFACRKELADQGIQPIQVVDDLLRGIIEQWRPCLLKPPSFLLRHGAVNQAHTLKCNRQGGFVVER